MAFMTDFCNRYIIKMRRESLNYHFALKRLSSLLIIILITIEVFYKLQPSAGNIVTTSHANTIRMSRLVSEVV